MDKDSTIDILPCFQCGEPIPMPKPMPLVPLCIDCQRSDESSKDSNKPDKEV